MELKEGELSNLFIPCLFKAIACACGALVIGDTTSTNFKVYTVPSGPTYSSNPSSNAAVAVLPALVRSTEVPSVLFKF